MIASSGHSDIAKIGKQPLWRSLLLCLALATFALQSYVGQTHIHPLVAAHTLSFSAPDGSGRQGQDPADCPICTHIQLSGYYITPAENFAAPLLVVQAMSRFFAATPLLSTGVSHIWHGRGPPSI